MEERSINKEMEILPEELVFQILVWLPVLSLLRLKAVCKSWYSLIQNPDFITKHYNHPHIPDEQENLVIVNNTCDCHGEYLFISLRSGKTEFDRLFEIFDLPKSFQSLVPYTYLDGEVCLHHDHRLIPIASYNGVICLQYGFCYKDFLLYNPALKQLRILPETPFLESISQSPCLINGGFGFDFRTKDYKVVRVVQETPNLYANPINNTHVDVYSLSENSWKTIEAVVPPITIRRGLPYPILSGSYFCWLADIIFSLENQTSHKTILSFDFSKEVFETMPLPEVYDINAELQLDLGLFEDNIACTETVAHVALDKSEFNIWILREYGVKESWTKLYTINLEGFTIPRAFLEDGDIIFFKSDLYRQDESQLGIWNPVTKELKILPEQECLHVQPYEVLVYKESLLSIKTTSRCN